MYEMAFHLDLLPSPTRMTRLLVTKNEKGVQLGVCPIFLRMGSEKLGARRGPSQHTG
jgi:hypothetical protein